MKCSDVETPNADDKMMGLNNGVAASVDVLEKYFRRKCEITPELSTTAILDELKEGISLKKVIQELQEAENSGDFPKVEKEFCVIESDTITVIIYTPWQSRSNGDMETGGIFRSIRFLFVEIGKISGRSGKLQRIFTNGRFLMILFWDTWLVY